MNMLWLHTAGAVNIMEPISIKVIINCILQILWLGLQQPTNGYMLNINIYVILLIYVFLAIYYWSLLVVAKLLPLKYNDYLLKAFISELNKFIKS